MNDYINISDMYSDYNMDMGLTMDETIKSLLDVYLKENHDDFFEDEQLVEKTIPEFNFVK
jgi:hypothetical protein